MEVTENEFVEVRGSKIHSRGVFAKRDIKKGTRVVEYVGEKISKEEGTRRAYEVMDEAESDPSKGAVYIFTLDDEYDLDGNVPENLARFVNHSCDPNCEAVDEDGRIWYEAIRNIAAGEELSINYGYDLDMYEDHPCHCGAENCIGYILDKKYWKKLKRLQDAGKA